MIRGTLRGIRLAPCHVFPTKRYSSRAAVALESRPDSYFQDAGQPQKRTQSSKSALLGRNGAVTSKSKSQDDSKLNSRKAAKKPSGAVPKPPRRVGSRQRSRKELKLLKKEKQAEEAKLRTTLTLDDNARNVVEQSLKAAVFTDLPQADIVQPKRLSRSFRQLLSSNESKAKSGLLLRWQNYYKETTASTELANVLKGLPMRQQASKVVEMVENKNNVYSIIVGATGSGKTTQVPQILLEHAITSGRGAECNILCTQPRKIAATSVAARVASERNQPVGKQVGHHVRFSAQFPEHGGSITYCTTGILIARLQAGEDIFKMYSHLIIDEVHERTIETDLLLNILKQKITSGNKGLKVVLMSATMDTELFSSYFGNPADATSCPNISVPGRTFPVQSFYLDDILPLIENRSRRNGRGFRHSEATTKYIIAERKFAEEHGAVQSSVEDSIPENNDLTASQTPIQLVTETIAYLCNTTRSGDILVFLPGLRDLEEALETLQSGWVGDINFMDSERYKIYMLHSTKAEAQAEVFEKLPARRRKIILSNNIAETSITLPQVQYVVDAGKQREKTFDPFTRTSQLQTKWISKSSSLQRAGRAGRVQNGNYYALFSRTRFEAMPKSALPEIRRADLRDVCLTVKAQHLEQPVQEFLQSSIEPPDPEGVRHAINDLKDLGALTCDQDITPLGQLLISLSLSPQFAKLVVLGVIYRCLEPMLILATCGDDLFKSSDDNTIREKFAMGSGSDHVAVINAFYYMQHLWKGGEQQLWDFSKATGLDARTFLIARREIEQISSTLLLGTSSNQALNRHSENDDLIIALLTSTLYPNLGRLAGTTRYELIPHSGMKERISTIDSSSVNFVSRANLNSVGAPRPTFLVFSTLMSYQKGIQLQLRSTTSVPPLTAALFGGSLSPDRIASHMRDDRIDYLKANGHYFATSSGLANSLIQFQKVLRNMESHGFSMLADRIMNKRGKAQVDLSVQWVIAGKLASMLKTRVYSSGRAQEVIEMAETLAPNRQASRWSQGHTSRRSAFR